MAVNSSLSCGGAPASLGPPDSAGVGAPGTDPEAAGSSAFSMMLSGMTETPASKTGAQAPGSTDEVEDPALPDQALSPADAAAQAIVAALMPAIATPIAAPLKQALPAESLPAVSLGTARLPEMPALDNETLAAAWLVAATRAAPSDAASDAAPQDIPGDGESLEHLALGAQSIGGTGPGGSPATGFSPMMQVSQLGSAVAQATTNVLQPQPPLQHGVGTARWAEELGTRLTLMASQGQLSGSMTLSPEHLGPLHVQIDIKNDVASVWFGSQHADTRAALNDALPRLREMFGASGLVLGDTGVSRDTPRQEAHAAEARRFAAQREDSVLTSSERRAVHIVHAGILDTYA
jgi:flagellar hook-length control protein FliK